MLRKKSFAWVALMTAAVLAMGSMAGCGKGAEEKDVNTQTGTDTEIYVAKEEYLLKNLDVDQYVTLGDYKNLKVEKPVPSVEEDELLQLMNQIYVDSYPAELGVTDRPVEMGDAANIDFEGKKDGVAFEGGTSAGYNLVIGSGSFIDGFEDGLVGVMPGETVDLPLSFPEVYPNDPDLAGQPVVFTVKVNYIIPAEKTDEAVKNFGVEDVTTVEELRQYVYDYLYEYSVDACEVEFEEMVLDAFMGSCTYGELPQEMLDDYRAKARANVAAVAANMGTDADTYIQYFYGITLDTFLDEYCDTALRQNLAMQAVANKEGLRIEDEELDQILAQDAESAGYDSVEAFVGSGSKEDFRDYFMYEKVLEYLLGIAGGESK